MTIKSWICLAFVIIALLCMILTKKIRCLQLVKDTFRVLTNYKTNKIYSHDIFAFFVCPIVLSFAIIIGLDFYFSKKIAEILLTVFSILFTLLFGVMSFITSLLDSNNIIKKQISRETFTAVSFCMLSSFLSLILLIIYNILLEQISNVICFQIISGVIISLGINLIMMFLMIIKRSYSASLVAKN